MMVPTAVSVTVTIVREVVAVEIAATVTAIGHISHSNVITLFFPKHSSLRALFESGAFSTSNASVTYTH